MSTRTLLRTTAGGVVIVAALGTLAVPFLAADLFADRIQDGDDLKMSLLPATPGLAALRMSVSTIDGQDLSAEHPATACLHVLGSAGGIVVLYDHESDTVLRIPQEQVSLEHPCR